MFYLGSVYKQKNISSLGAMIPTNKHAGNIYYKT